MAWALGVLAVAALIAIQHVSVAALRDRAGLSQLLEDIFRVVLPLVLAAYFLLSAAEHPADNGAQLAAAGGFSAALIWNVVGIFRRRR